MGLLDGQGIVQTFLPDGAGAAYCFCLRLADESFMLTLEPRRRKEHRSHRASAR